jgi:hypothetical protein
MATLRTVISDLEEGEASEVIDSTASAPDEKVMSIAFLRPMASAPTSTEPGASDEDEAPAEDLPAEDLPAEAPPEQAPPEDYPRSE